MSTAVYSTEWAADTPVGEALVNLVCDELRRRGIPYTLDYTPGVTGGLNLTQDLRDMDQPERYRAVMVATHHRASATEALDHVLQRRQAELKQQAIEVAKTRGYLTTDDEREEYERALHDAYGW